MENYMTLIRTPEERFKNLNGYTFAPNYLEINGARVHYLDEGAGEVILCLHGEPTWSFLYRKMIPILAGSGRVIAPDFIGFGKSDKYTEMSDYSFQMHRDTLTTFIEKLDLHNITVIVQDWGGLLGLRVATEMPQRFARLVILNTFLPTGEEKPSRAFKVWQAYSQRADVLDIGRVIDSACITDLSDEVIRGYEAPFPGKEYMAGAKIFPSLVPTEPHHPGVDSMKHARAVLSHWTKPAIVMFSDKDPILGGADKFFRRLIPTTQDQPEITIHNAGHFLQEDKGEEIAQHIVEFITRTPL